MKKNFKYTYCSTLMGLRSYISDTLGSTIDGIQYYNTHKHHKCYKCGIRGHIAADCANICAYCNNLHINGICIWHINNYIESLLTKIDEITEKHDEAKLVLYAETLKEKYMKIEGNNTIFNKSKTKNYAATFKVSKTNTFKINPTFYSTTLTIPATAASGNKDPIFSMSTTRLAINKQYTQMHAEYIKKMQELTELDNKRIEFYNYCVGKYGKNFTKINKYKIYGTKQQLYDNAEEAGLQLPYFFKDNYIKQFLKDKEIFEKYNDEIQIIDEKEKELLKELPNKYLEFEYKETRTKVGKLGITMGNNKNIEYTGRKAEYYKIKRQLIKLMNKTHNNPLLEKFYNMIHNNKLNEKYKDELDKQINRLEKEIQHKTKIANYKEQAIVHKDKIVNKIINNAKNKAEKIRQYQIERNAKMTKKLDRQYKKQKYEAEKATQLTTKLRDTINNAYNIKSEHKQEYYKYKNTPNYKYNKDEQDKQLRQQMKNLAQDTLHIYNEYENYY